MVKGFHPLTIYAYTIKMRKWKNDGKIEEKIADRRKIQNIREIPYKWKICCRFA